MDQMNESLLGSLARILCFLQSLVSCEGAEVKCNALLCLGSCWKVLKGLGSRRTTSANGRHRFQSYGSGSGWIGCGCWSRRGD